MSAAPLRRRRRRAAAVMDRTLCARVAAGAVESEYKLMYGPAKCYKACNDATAVTWSYDARLRYTVSEREERRWWRRRW